MALHRTNLFVRILIYGALVLAAIVFLAPFAWMISTSLKPLNETMSLPPR